MKSLKDKTLLITGASRGIGKAIALRAAEDGANVIVVAKTVTPHPKLPGTIHRTVEEVEALGGQALAVAADIRYEEQVEQAVEKGVEHFGGVDILVNNASAISLTGTLETPMKVFDLMLQINGRGSYLCAQKCLPHLFKASNPHILNLSPPPSLDPKWWQHHGAYTLAKSAMSFWVLGMAEEFRSQGVGVNALWPRTTIATAAVKNLLGGEQMMERSRKPEMVAEAAHAILTRDSRQCTGNFFLDEEVLREEGVKDFTQYSVNPDLPLQVDLFVEK